jgi:hypothetical protein
MNYIVIEHVLFVINHIMDLIICVWYCYCVSYCYCVWYWYSLMICVWYCDAFEWIPIYSACFGGSSFGEATKIGSGKKSLYSLVNRQIKWVTRQLRVTFRAQYIRRFTDEYNGSPVRPVLAPLPHYVRRWYITDEYNGYIRQFHVTDEYMVIFVGTDK